MGKADINRLLVQTARGDNAAFSRLYEQTGRGVYAFLYTYFHNKEDTEDALQTVYLKIKRNAASFKPNGSGRAWILQIAKNHAINELKKNSRTVCAEEIDLGTTEGVSVGSVNDTMQRVLTEEEQQIITLHVLWGYKHKEIAKMFDHPVGTITSKYKRAVEKLRTALKEVD